jgi:CRP-like cAMP-binding protein
LDQARIKQSDSDALRQMRLFQEVPDDLAEDLIARLRVARVEKGSLLFSAGEPAGRFFGVLEGWVKVFTRTADGEEAVLGLFSRGETFAEAAMFLDEQYPASAEAVAESRLCIFDKVEFERDFISNPAFCKAMLAAVSHHLMRMTKELQQLQLRSGEERLLRFLLSLCSHTSQSCTLHLPYDKSLIAKRLGMKPETLSRTFRKLRRNGVKVDGTLVTIADPEAIMKDLGPKT